MKFVPVIVTRPPPAVERKPTLSEAITSKAPAGVMVNWSAAEADDVPEGVWMVTSMGDAGVVVQARATAVTVPSALTVNEAAGVEPKKTAVAPARLIPEMTMRSPPLENPLL